MCQTCADAPGLAAQGGHVVSTDEKTGIQALERIHPTKPTRPGQTERIERLIGFIGYFNAVLAKPFRWTCSGTPLRT